MLVRAFTTSILLGSLSCASPATGGDATRETDAFDSTDVTDVTDVSGDTVTPVDVAKGALTGRLVFDKFNNQVGIPGRNKEVGLVDGAMTLTDDNGNYTLATDATGGGLLRASLPGEISVQRAITIPPSTDRLDLHVIDIDAYVGTVNRLGGDFDAFSFGMVVVRFIGATQPGYTATIGATHGGSFVFTPPDAFGTAVATDTTRANGDSVYFYAVTPGTTTLTLTSPPGAAPCVDPYEPSTHIYPVTVGTFTEIVLRCP